MVYIDAHCHVSTVVDGEVNIPGENEIVQCVMSTNQFDWEIVKNMGASSRRVASFGIHPWYCHMFIPGKCTVDKRAHYSDVLDYKDTDEFESLLLQLPDPLSLEKYIAAEFNPASVAVVGEIGLDKLFRLPTHGFFKGNRETSLTRVRVKMSHQLIVFRRLCTLATIYGKSVSIHCVKCHGLLFDTCKELLLPFREVNICLHSYTGTIDILNGFWFKQFPVDRVYLSLSKWINFKSEQAAKDLIQALPKSSILTETDFPIDMCPPERLQEELLHICLKITEYLQLKSTERCKDMIYKNFQRFIK